MRPGGTSANVSATTSIFRDNYNTGWQAQANSNSTLTAHLTDTDLTNNNAAMIIAGTVVGSAGTLLTQLMAKAMNRPIRNVIFTPITGAAK